MCREKRCCAVGDPSNMLYVYMVQLEFHGI